MNNTQYQKELYLKRLSFALDYLGGKCVKCDSKDSLEFDHIDPSKKNCEVTVILKGNLERLIRELDLCQLLCTSCHKNKTKKSREPWQHGTIHGYQNKKCRCPDCKQIQREYKAKYLGKELKKTRECGTYAMYKSGCRCDECRIANREYMREYMRKLKNKG